MAILFGTLVSSYWYSSIDHIKCRTSFIHSYFCIQKKLKSQDFELNGTNTNQRASSVSISDQDIKGIVRKGPSGEKEKREGRIGKTWKKANYEGVWNNIR